MTGKTHLCFGIGVSFLALRPETLGACFGVLAGAAIGGVIADIDMPASAGKGEGYIISAAAMMTTAAAFAADAATGKNLIHEILNGADVIRFLGLALFLGLGLAGALTAHRSFMHSLLGWALFTGAVCLAAPPLTGAFGMAYGSHLALDMLNKKGMPLLFPMKRRFSLKLFRADGIADKLLLGLSLPGAAALIVTALIRSA